MSESVYRFFRAKSTEAWYRLSKDEQDDLIAKINENTEHFGGKFMITCDCAWASEQWQFWGVTVFPNVEALQKHTAFQIELGWHRFLEVESMLGTEFTE